VQTFAMQESYIAVKLLCIRRLPIYNSVQLGRCWRGIETILSEWVALHRRHHQYGDSPDDPHSPHYFGRFGPRQQWAGSLIAA
jgi:hypothetical protein